MKQLIPFLFLPLFSKAQLVSCPGDLNFKKDTLVINYSLVSGGTTPWTPILNLSPSKDAKEGFTYDEWIPLQTNVNPVSDFLTTVLATQYRQNKQSGEIQMQAYYCVFAYKGTKALPKDVKK